MDSHYNKQQSCHEGNSVISPEKKTARHLPKHEYALRKRQKICYDEDEDTDEMSLDTIDDTENSTENYTRSLNSLT